MLYLENRRSLSALMLHKRIQRYEKNTKIYPAYPIRPVYHRPCEQRCAGEDVGDCGIFVAMHSTVHIYKYLPVAVQPGEKDSAPAANGGWLRAA